MDRAVAGDPGDGPRRPSVVFSPGFFFPPEVAGKAFWTSLTLGLGLFLLVGVLLVVDAVSRRVLGIDLPLPTILVLVITIAVYEPARWPGPGPRIGGRTPRDIARERLLARPRPAGAHAPRRPTPASSRR